MNQILDNYLNAGILAKALPAVLSGFWVTVEVALCVIVLGVVLGLVLALLRLLENRLINILVIAWIELFRTLPQLVIMIFIYFALPYSGITLSPFAATALALAAVLSAFCAEIFYAAIMALPKGQWEASTALGMRMSVTLFLIILPQAVRLATPLITNRAISITKGTALGISVSLQETLANAQSAMAMLANPSPLTLAAAFYLLFFVPLVVFSRWVEWRVSREG